MFTLHTVQITHNLNSTRVSHAWDTRTCRSSYMHTRVQILNNTRVHAHTLNIRIASLNRWHCQLGWRYLDLLLSFLLCSPEMKNALCKLHVHKYSLSYIYSSVCMLATYTRRYGTGVQPSLHSLCSKPFYMARILYGTTDRLKELFPDMQLLRILHRRISACCILFSYTRACDVLYILQVFFLQDLQDLTLNLANISQVLH